MITEVILPQLGQTMSEGTIIEWLIAEGDRVSPETDLFRFESDKATLEVQAPKEGVLRKILVSAGTTCPVLSPVALIAEDVSEDISSYLSQGEKVTTEHTKKQSVERPIISNLDTGVVDHAGTRARGRISISPRARLLARKMEMDIEHLQGSGEGGRIIEKDVKLYLEARPKISPVAMRMAEKMGIDLASIKGTGPGSRITKGDVETALQESTKSSIPLQETLVKRSISIIGLRKTIADRMSSSLHNAARVTLMSEVDATAMVALHQRLVEKVGEQWGFKPGFNDLFIFIVAKALSKFPYMNARMHGDVIEELANINIGLAVDTDEGLKVVVIRNADHKGLQVIGSEVRNLVERAQTGVSLPDELTGGTFTITNLGKFGIDGFTPIMNPPEIAILGVGRIMDKPAVVDGKIEIRSMVTLSLSFDHRLVDGAPAARFLQFIANLVEEPALLLI
jgi:pyruvate dehydrogenase E2 component (dihydrolipoyllysine-residue acetyltransferase)